MFSFEYFIIVCEWLIIRFPVCHGKQNPKNNKEICFWRAMRPRLLKKLFAVFPGGPSLVIAIPFVSVILTMNGAKGMNLVSQGKLRRSNIAVLASLVNDRSMNRSTIQCLSF
jgi:hypothetical protein